MAYLIDANVFIQGKNLHYAMDFCPAFWDWLVHANSDGRVFSIEKVAHELAAGEDDLTRWAAERGPEFFLPPDSAVLSAMGRVARWVSDHRFEPAAMSTFLQVADSYLVAHALAHQLVIVTHEKPDASLKRVKIPNACVALGVTCMTPFEMVRRERARFVLGSL